MPTTRIGPHRSGVVDAFDDDAGLGTVRTHDGEHLAFHCTAVADGSRTIAVGTAVRFAVAAGHHGRWEAVDVVPDGPSAD